MVSRSLLRLLSLSLISISLLASLVAGPRPVYAATPAVGIWNDKAGSNNIVDASKVVGSTLIVEVNASGISGLINAFDVVVNYDATVLTANRISLTADSGGSTSRSELSVLCAASTAGQFCNPPLLTTVNDTTTIPGTMELGTACLGCFVPGTGMLFSIVFTVRALTSSTPLTIFMAEVDNPAPILPLARISGSFTNVARDDVAVTSVTATPTAQTIGQPVDIAISVTNNGNLDETGVLVQAVAANSTKTVTVGSQTISVLKGATVASTITWVTTGFTAGDYTISGTATLAAGKTDANPGDNTKTDGTVRLSAVPVPFDYSLTVSPNSASVVKGQSTMATITATLVAGTAEPVILSATGLPSAMATFTPPSGNPTFMSTVKIVTASSTPTGSFPITITGTSVSGLVRTTTFTLTVGSVDVAVTNIVSPPRQMRTRTVTVNVTVANLGTGPASFQVDLIIFNDTKTFTAGASGVTSLAPGDSRKVQISVNTGTLGIDRGNYTLTASIPPLPFEMIVSNNQLTSAKNALEILPFMDVALLSVVAQPSPVIFGDNTTITVTVVNYGDVGATTTLFVAASKGAVDIDLTAPNGIDIIDLQPNQPTPILVKWNTTAASAGTWLITATLSTISLKGIQEPTNNNDGQLGLQVNPDAPPTVNIIMSPQSPVAGQSVHFDGSTSVDPDGTLKGYLWDFGDGSPKAATLVVDHTFAAAGTYTVTLTVTDDRGLSSTKNLVVFVSLSLTLTVKDNQGNPVLGATVVLKDSTGAEVARSITNGLGSVTFSGLEPGTYTVEASRSGFETTKKTLTLAGGPTLQDSLTIAPVVSGAAPLSLLPYFAGGIGAIVVLGALALVRRRSRAKRPASVPQRAS